MHSRIHIDKKRAKAKPFFFLKMEVNSLNRDFWINKNSVLFFLPLKKYISNDQSQHMPITRHSTMRLSTSKPHRIVPQSKRKKVIVS